MVNNYSPLFGGCQCIETIGMAFFGTSFSIPCREVFYIMSLSILCHYWTFHCTVMHIAHEHVSITTSSQCSRQEKVKA